jgi:hypothetical protein
MALLALVVVGLSTLIPVLGALIVAPLAALFVGAGAGWWASKELGYGTAGRGAGAGAIAGIGALLGPIIILTIAATILGRSAAFQQQVQQGLESARQQNPGADVPNLNPAALATAGGALGGFCLGLVYLLLSTIGGLIGGLVYGRNRGQAAAPPVAMYPGTTSTAGVPQMTNTAMPPTMATPAPPSETEQDRAARIYPDTDRDTNARIYPDNEQR